MAAISDDTPLLAHELSAEVFNSLGRDEGIHEGCQLTGIAQNMSSN